MQMIPFSLPLLVLSCLIYGAAQAYAACVVTGNPPSWRAFSWFSGMVTLNALLSLITGLKNHPLLVPLSILLIIITLRMALQLKGWRLLQSFLIQYMMILLCELACSPIMIFLLTDEQVQAARYFQSPICLLVQFMFAILYFVMTQVYSFFRSLRTHRMQLLVIGRCARILLMSFVIFVLYASISPQDVHSVGEHAMSIRLTPTLAVMVILTGVSSSYLYQDIQYTLLYQQNRTLVQNQESQDMLLRRSRMFHHNLANILCGLQGTIHSRDFSSIDSYCDEIVRHCQIINNENVQSLRQIPRPAVSLLIQQKILDANEAGVPFYVHADDKLRWRGWRDGDMCQLLGVLLDNALEATSRSDAPYISLELHNLRDGMELVVRNTWGEKTGDTPPAVSTAPSRGLGLPSVQALLKRYRRTTFSLYHRDRYVEAHLIFS